jgi:hypothetical protein
MRRWRAALERGPRLRAAPDHPPRDPPRLQARHRRPFFHRWSRARAADGRGLSGARRAQRAQVERRAAQEEERFAETLSRAWRCSKRRSPRAPSAARRQARGRARPVRRRDRLQAVRHLRLSGGPHGRRRARARASRSTRRASRRRWTRSASAPARRAASASTCAAAQLEAKTEFRGYDGTQGAAGRRAARKDGASRRAQARRARRGRARRTPFYAESGGQVGDAASSSPAACAFTVSRTRRSAAPPIAHRARSCRRRRDPRRRAVAAQVDARRVSRDRLEPLGHAPAARRAARGAGHARAAEGLAGRARPAALRLLALPGR